MNSVSRFALMLIITSSGTMTYLWRNKLIWKQLGNVQNFSSPSFANTTILSDVNTWLLLILEHLSWSSLYVFIGMHSMCVACLWLVHFLYIGVERKEQIIFNRLVVRPERFYQFCCFAFHSASKPNEYYAKFVSSSTGICLVWWFYYLRWRKLFVFCVACFRE